ncbi:winged helix-turn-helix transcriptional regulator, partial [Enterobacter hormaechei]
EAEILTLQGASDGTAYQEYVLTDKGERLFPVIVALRQWGEQNLFAQGERHSLLIDRRTGRPVPFMAPAAHDGTALLPVDTEVQKTE